MNKKIELEVKPLKLKLELGYFSRSTASQHLPDNKNIALQASEQEKDSQLFKLKIKDDSRIKRILLESTGKMI